VQTGSSVRNISVAINILQRLLLEESSPLRQINQNARSTSLADQSA
jgi:hypothetical protein